MGSKALGSTRYHGNYAQQKQQWVGVKNSEGGGIVIAMLDTVVSLCLTIIVITVTVGILCSIGYILYTLYRMIDG